MTTSMLKTETNVNAFGTETTYTFNVLSTETKTPITECMIVVDECDGEAYVWYSFDTYTSKQKFFKDTFEAHMYAMKVAKKIKSQYN